jgi:protein translocase SEC61 complex gamma subunit
MDINQPTSGSPQIPENNKVEEQKDLKEKMSLPKLNVSLPKITMPKFSAANSDSKFNIAAYLINRLREYQRVIMITKKPDMEEFKATAKATGLGITIIGVIGFVI